jgi:hypothetical protein
MILPEFAWMRIYRQSALFPLIGQGDLRSKGHLSHRGDDFGLWNADFGMKSEKTSLMNHYVSSL